MKRAFVFPGQGAQFVGMGKALYDSDVFAKDLFEQADQLLGFKITDVMFNGSDEDLKQTRITQPAIFLHSVISFKVLKKFDPDMVAGHSLGEYSALVAAGVLSFEDGLQLVYKRALAMQKACNEQPSTMAAVLGMSDETIHDVCKSISGETVVVANYNCPDQVVISGTVKGVELVCEKLNALGAKRTIKLQVGGAFHSPLMQPAADDLKLAILDIPFNKPMFPIYQNVNAYPQIDPECIRQNLLVQLTSPVHWTQTIKNMILDGAEEFYECGPGEVLSGLIHRIDKNVSAQSIS